MKKRISPLAIGLLVIPYAIAWSISTALHFPLGMYVVFTKFFQFQYHMLGLVFFLATIWLASSGNTEERQFNVRLSRYWGIGFVFLLLLTTGTVAYVNPHSRFDNTNLPHVNAGARVIKKDYLLQLDETPDVILLGSSRAFTISPAYLKEKTQLSAFNMSVEGGRVGDFFIQLDYMLDAGIKPAVIIIELDIESLMGDHWNISEQPLSLVPHMPVAQGLDVYKESLRDTFGVFAFSDALFVLALPEEYNEEWWVWSFQSDGMGVRKDLDRQKYLQLLEETVSTRLQAHLRCRKFDLEATSALEATIQRAEENNIAVLLYSSPLNAVFYKVALKKDKAGLDSCSKFTADYFESLVAKYPHLIYKDLSEYLPVSDLEEDGYYDAVHLKPNAAQMVTDQLLAEIDLAYQWAQEQMGK